jgi:hypothetical protein
LVAFQETVFRPASNPPLTSIGGIVIHPNAAPIVIASSRGSLLSDRSGLVSVPASTGGAQGATEIQGNAVAGSGALPFQLEPFWPLNPQVSNTRVNAELRVSKARRAKRDVRCLGQATCKVLYGTGHRSSRPTFTATLEFSTHLIL